MYHLVRLGVDKRKKTSSKLRLHSNDAWSESRSIDKQEQVLNCPKSAAALFLLIYNGWGLRLDWSMRSMWCQPYVIISIQRSLRCHYCGYKEKVPRLLPRACGSNPNSLPWEWKKLKRRRVIELLFPEAEWKNGSGLLPKINYGYQRLWMKFGAGNLDILVGTQDELPKGLRLWKVTVVGIWDGDRISNFPDCFRAGERAYQQITQVAGEQVRREKARSVIFKLGILRLTFLRASNQRGIIKSFSAGNWSIGGNSIYPPNVKADSKSPLGIADAKVSRKSPRFTSTMVCLK